MRATGPTSRVAAAAVTPLAHPRRSDRLRRHPPLCRSPTGNSTLHGTESHGSRLRPMVGCGRHGSAVSVENDLRMGSRPWPRARRWFAARNTPSRSAIPADRRHEIPRPAPPVRPAVQSGTEGDQPLPPPTRQSDPCRHHQTRRFGWPKPSLTHKDWISNRCTPRKPSQELPCHEQICRERPGRFLCRNRTV